MLYSEVRDLQARDPKLWKQSDDPKNLLNIGDATAQIMPIRTAIQTGLFQRLWCLAFLDGAFAVKEERKMRFSFKAPTSLSNLLRNCVLTVFLCTSTQAAVHTAWEGSYLTTLPTSFVPGRPDVVLRVTPLLDESNAQVTAPLGVYFSAAAKAWTIYTQDFTPMPLGSKFFVSYSIPDGSSAFVHQASSGNTANGVTYLSTPGCPYSASCPFAHLQIIPEFSPGKTFGGYDNSQVATWFDPAANEWTVFNQDGSPIPEGLRIHVTVFSNDTSFVVSPLTSPSNRIYLGRPHQDFNLYSWPTVEVHVTAQFGYDQTLYPCFFGSCPQPRPGEFPQANRAVAAQYDSGRSQWFITTEEGSLIPLFTPFTVSVFTNVPG